MPTRTEPLQAVPEFRDWKITWDRMTFTSLGRYRTRTDSDVPWRRCPHGGWFIATDIAPPIVENAYIWHDMPGCDDKRCLAQYREAGRNR